MVPTIAHLCQLYEVIVQQNETSSQSSMAGQSIATRLNLERKDFSQLLKLMNAKCLDEEAFLFFDYLIGQKIKLYQQLYPHFDIQLQTTKYLTDNQYSASKDKSSDASQYYSNQQFKPNEVSIPQKISFTEFIMFFQRDFNSLFKEQKSIGRQMPSVALALRVTVDIFRVLSKDQSTLSINSLIGYLNRSEHYPLSMSQTLDLFQVTEARNIDQAKNVIPSVLAKARRDKASMRRGIADDRSHLELRTYDLLGFIKQFVRPVEIAINQLGSSFIEENCLNKMKEQIECEE